ncbi:hypothetical protein GQ44DRAFT_702568 [Phaeosphaeriaceae sp. PMI808]|nr:hypothetical protein GQ44DRAFT_702568 [Phaeosphaeriaceae sp. PMI808]
MAEPISSIWERIGLQEEDFRRCLRALQEKYTGCRLQEFGEQGYCSYTLIVSSPNISSLIIQIRPIQHALNLSIAQAAKRSYPFLAPIIQHLPLKLPPQICAYEMEKKCGIPVSRLLPRNQVLDPILWKKHTKLIESFAAFIASGWQSSVEERPEARSRRADSPMEDTPEMLSQCTGKVGSSIICRLEKLCNELPDASLKQIAKSTLTEAKAMNDYPVVLNHGDLIPSNILIDEDTWEITGVVDWAEAEYLPFGVCLYGLEHLLGYVTPVSPPSQTIDETPSLHAAPKFVYFDHAPFLRDLFWTHLFEALPSVKMKREDVMTMRNLGVLLWYGYAWDDGAINRVVNETDDVVEVACLRTFLDFM